MALVVLCAVLKIPVMRAGVTPPRCDRRRRRGRLFRRGIWTFGRPRASPCRFKPCSGWTNARTCDRLRVLLHPCRLRDGIGMRDAGNAAPHGALTGIFGQQIHLTSQFVLIHARSSRGGTAATPTPTATATTSPSSSSTAAATPTTGRASIVVVPATPSGWHPAASPTSGLGSTAPSRRRGW